MTVLQVASALIGFIIYPIVIRRIGVEQYGLYVFILSVVLYFQVVIEFGFDFPALKTVSLHPDDKRILSEVVSAVFYLKSLLFVMMAVVASVVVWAIPMLRDYAWLFVVIFAQNAINILFPQWYFQGRKAMRTPVVINFVCRLLQIPLVLLFVHTQQDVFVYALIVSGTMVMGGVAAMAQIYHEGVHLCRVPLNVIRDYIKAGWPFFLTDLATNVKDRVQTNLIAVCLGLQEVAIYDLATKVVQIPRLFTQSVNKALFPEMVTNPSPARIQKVVRYERMIALAMMLAVAVFGYPVILFLGGWQMIAAYPIAVLLSITIYTWLEVGAYLQFVFIPHNRYSWVTLNQVIACLSCLLLMAAGLFWRHNLYIFVSALVVSGFAELLFCRIMIKKHRLL